MPRCVRLLQLLAACSQLARVHAAPFGSASTNVIVYRFWGNTSALSAIASAVWLDEYAPPGGGALPVRPGPWTLVQSVLLPGCTVSGSATSEGMLTRAMDGGELLCPCYVGVPVGQAGPATAAGGTRGVTLVNASGVVSRVAVAADTASAANARCGAAVGAASADVYIGTSSYLRLSQAGGGSASITSPVASLNIRQVSVVNVSGVPRMMVSGTMAAVPAFVSVANGSGTLPNPSNIAAIVPPLLTGAFPFTPATPCGFAILAPDASLMAVCYQTAATDGVLILRSNGSHWSVNRSATSSSCRGLVERVELGRSILYTTSSGGSPTDGQLLRWDWRNLSQTAPSVIATAPAYSAFRGVALPPVIVPQDTAAPSPATTPAYTKSQTASASFGTSTSSTSTPSPPSTPAVTQSTTASVTKGASTSGTPTPTQTAVSSTSTSTPSSSETAVSLTPTGTLSESPPPTLTSTQTTTSSVSYGVSASGTPTPSETAVSLTPSGTPETAISLSSTSSPLAVSASHAPFAPFAGTAAFSVTLRFAGISAAALRAAVGNSSTVLASALGRFVACAAASQLVVATAVTAADALNVPLAIPSAPCSATGARALQLQRAAARDLQATCDVVLTFTSAQPSVASLDASLAAGGDVAAAVTTLLLQPASTINAAAQSIAGCFSAKMAGTNACSSSIFNNAYAALTSALSAPLASLTRRRRELADGITVSVVSTSAVALASSGAAAGSDTAPPAPIGAIVGGIVGFAVIGVLVFVALRASAARRQAHGRGGGLSGRNLAKSGAKNVAPRKVMSEAQLGTSDDAVVFSALNVLRQGTSASSLAANNNASFRNVAQQPQHQRGGGAPAPAAAPAPAPTKSADVLPGGWQKIWDASAKAHYYHHSATGETTWDPPTV